MDTLKKKKLNRGKSVLQIMLSTVLIHDIVSVLVLMSFSQCYLQIDVKVTQEKDQEKK